MMSWTNAISRCSVKSSPDTFSIGKATSSRVSTGSVAAAHPENRQDVSVGPSIDDGVAKPVTCADRDLRHQQDKDETEPVHCTALPGSWAASMAHAFSIEDRGLRPNGLEMSRPANTWSCAVGWWVRGNAPLKPNRSMEQLGRNLMDWVDPRHFGRLCDARALAASQTSVDWKNLRAPAASSDPARRMRSLGLSQQRKTLGGAPG